MEIKNIINQVKEKKWRRVLFNCQRSNLVLKLWIVSFLHSKKIVISFKNITIIMNYCSFIIGIFKGNVENVRDIPFFPTTKTSFISRKTFLFFSVKLSVELSAVFPAEKPLPCFRCYAKWPSQHNLYSFVNFLSSAWQNFLELSWKGTFFFTFFQKESSPTTSRRGWYAAPPWSSWTSPTMEWRTRW